MRIQQLSSAVVLIVMAVAASLGAQGRGQGQGQGQGQSQGQSRGRGAGTDTSVSVSVVFTGDHRTTFGDYFRRHKIVGKPLPPGIAKNVARGKPLPPGIAKQALPPELVGIVMRNTAVPRDTTFAIVGDVVVATRRGVVVDVMTGLFR